MVRVKSRITMCGGRKEGRREEGRREEGGKEGGREGVTSGLNANS